MYSKKTLVFVCCFIVCVNLIFMYGKYRCDNPNFKDILETRLGIGELDGWSLSHLSFFMFIGYHFEGKYLIAAFLLGILWEGFEHYYGTERPGWLGGYGDCDMQTNREGGSWWYGKWSDIVMNTIGLLSGHYLLKNKFKIR